MSFKQELIGPTICKTFQGLNKDQMEICQQYPDVTSSAMDGLQLAVDECQYQFQWHRWNCSSLSTKNRNPRNSILLQRGKLASKKKSFFLLTNDVTNSSRTRQRRCWENRFRQTRVWSPRGDIN